MTDEQVQLEHEKRKQAGREQAARGAAAFDAGRIGKQEARDVAGLRKPKDDIPTWVLVLATILLVFVVVPAAWYGWSYLIVSAVRYAIANP